MGHLLLNSVANQYPLINFLNTLLPFNSQNSRVYIDQDPAPAITHPDDETARINRYHLIN